MTVRGLWRLPATYVPFLAFLWVVAAYAVGDEPEWWIGLAVAASAIVLVGGIYVYVGAALPRKFLAGLEDAGAVYEVRDVELLWWGERRVTVATLGGEWILHSTVGKSPYLDVTAPNGSTATVRSKVREAGAAAGRGDLGRAGD